MYGLRADSWREREWRRKIPDNGRIIIQIFFT
jgi:hypothetical protein